MNIKRIQCNFKNYFNSHLVCLTSLTLTAFGLLLLTLFLSDALSLLIPEDKVDKINTMLANAGVEALFLALTLGFLEGILRYDRERREEKRTAGEILGHWEYIQLVLAQYRIFYNQLVTPQAKLTQDTISSENFAEFDLADLSEMYHTNLVEPERLYKDKIEVYVKHFRALEGELKHLLYSGALKNHNEVKEVCLETLNTMYLQDTSEILLKNRELRYHDKTVAQRATELMVNTNYVQELQKRYNQPKVPAHVLDPYVVFSTGLKLLAVSLRRLENLMRDLEKNCHRSK